MAFNPFHRFRKHQKTFFAILTIICMFVFVLQFGRGDAIERLMGLFGASRARGEYITTLNGAKLYTAELDRLGRRREMADKFIRGIMEQASQEAQQQAFMQERSTKDEAKDTILGFVTQGMFQRRMDQSLAPQARLDQIRSSIMILNESKKSK